MEIIKWDFKYEKLDESSDTQPIRLLKLYLSTDFDQEIESELLYSSLKGRDCVEFEALSLCLGNVHDPENGSSILLRGPTHPITENIESALRYLGLLRGCTHPITKILESALQHLRFEDKERVLWWIPFELERQGGEEPQISQSTTSRDVISLAEQRKLNLVSISAR
jgi:hypothetical protein